MECLLALYMDCVLQGIQASGRDRIALEGMGALGDMQAPVYEIWMCMEQGAIRNIL